MGARGNNRRNIQIQHLLKLNVAIKFFATVIVVNSNTTLVKVKYIKKTNTHGKNLNSNTTLVKVKSIIFISL